jgi:hypothetical protein
MKLARFGLAGESSYPRVAAACEERCYDGRRGCYDGRRLSAARAKPLRQLYVDSLRSLVAGFGVIGDLRSLGE